LQARSEQDGLLLGSGDAVEAGDDQGDVLQGKRSGIRVWERGWKHGIDQFFIGADGALELKGSHEVVVKSLIWGELLEGDEECGGQGFGADFGS